ncbi:DNA-binding protein [Thiospirochaeta perfilievii]|uniref:DNA-binding protein n=1 Tax=Thiospirochaeta perfilievii TaxID=252967 RepID=A0A5C1Q8H9_9SPIO|nr:helix-turn-helix domain-containing protein [Thiospirochaeta perfilievii]QEN03350.1 DNA-binding protein [Thiospirochaeta perfilievii]
MTDNILNAKEAAKYLGNLSIHCIYKYSSQGIIPKLKHTGKLLFLKSDLDDFIIKNRVSTHTINQISRSIKEVN